jgi:hypothetical protein
MSRGEAEDFRMAWTSPGRDDRGQFQAWARSDAYRGKIHSGRQLAARRGVGFEEHWPCLGRLANLASVEGLDALETRLLAPDAQPFVYAPPLPPPPTHTWHTSVQITPPPSLFCTCLHHHHVDRVPRFTILHSFASFIHTTTAPSAAELALIIPFALASRLHTRTQSVTARRQTQRTLTPSWQCPFQRRTRGRGIWSLILRLQRCLPMPITCTAEPIPTT